MTLQDSHLFFTVQLHVFVVLGGKKTGCTGVTECQNKFQNIKVVTLIFN